MNLAALAGRERAVDRAAFALLALLPLALLPLGYPLQDLPFIDDWCYAWTVAHLLATGEFRVLEFSSSPLLTQALWGSLFAAPGGFSFAALRASTWVASVAGLAGLYALLRDLGVERAAAWLGVATLAAYPIWAVLSITYMTDVPFLALTLWAAFAVNRAMDRQRTGWLVLAAVLMALAAGIRTVAAVLPIATALTLALHAGRWGRAPQRLALALAPLTAVVGLHLWRATVTVVSADMSNVASSPANRVKDLPYAVSILPQMTVSTVGSAFAMVGIALLPVALGVLRRGELRRAALIGLGVVMALLALDQVMSLRFAFPLDYKQTWSWSELGATEQLVPENWLVVPPLWLSWALMALGCWSAAVIVLLPRDHWKRPGLALLAWFAAGYLGLSSLLWLTYDRYFLVLVPVAIAAVLAVRPLVNRRATLAALAVVAALTLVGLRDHLAYNATLWRAVAELRALGIAEADIDGGYIVNGWLQYAHPDKAHRGADGSIRIPMVNVTSDDEPRPYLIADRPRADRPTLRSLPYTRLIGLSGAIHILGPRL